VPRGILHRLAVIDLTLGENAMEKAFSKALERMLDACRLDDIDADAEHAHPG
jgi:hypothetical protein